MAQSIHDITVDMLNRIHKGVLAEEAQKNEGDAVPYTQQDDIFNSSIETARTQFGADFSQHENPMLYYPNDGDVVLSGTISSLNNAKFQFRYKESDGCYFWSDGLRLTKENLKKLNVVEGFYQNWRKELETMGDIAPISLQNQ